MSGKVFRTKNADYCPEKQRKNNKIAKKNRVNLALKKDRPITAGFFGVFPFIAPNPPEPTGIEPKSENDEV